MNATATPVKRRLFKAWHIYRRELAALYLSPLAYASMAVFLLISGYFFALILLGGQMAEMRGAFSNMGLTFLFMAPVLTMRLLADERRTGTDELLLTAPLSVTDIVVGKYMAVMTVYVSGLALTALYPWYLYRFGTPDWGPILSGYLGLILIGGAFLAVGLFASSVTDNQMVAGVIGFGLLLLFWVCGWAGETLTGRTGDVLASLSLLDRFTDFHKGMIDSSNVLFYLSYIFAFLYLAVRAVERRRWS